MWTTDTCFKNGERLTAEQRKIFHSIKNEKEARAYSKKCEKENYTDEYREFVESGEAGFCG